MEVNRCKGFMLEISEWTINGCIVFVIDIGKISVCWRVCEFVMSVWREIEQCMWDDGCVVVYEVSWDVWMNVGSLWECIGSDCVMHIEGCVGRMKGLNALN